MRQPKCYKLNAKCLKLLNPCANHRLIHLKRDRRLFCRGINDVQVLVGADGHFHFAEATEAKALHCVAVLFISAGDFEAAAPVADREVVVLVTAFAYDQALAGGEGYFGAGFSGGVVGFRSCGGSGRGRRYRAGDDNTVVGFSCFITINITHALAALDGRLNLYRGLALACIDEVNLLAIGNGKRLTISGGELYAGNGFAALLINDGGGDVLFAFVTKRCPVAIGTVFAEHEGLSGRDANARGALGTCSKGEERKKEEGKNETHLIGDLVSPKGPGKGRAVRFRLVFGTSRIVIWYFLERLERAFSI